MEIQSKPWASWSPSMQRALQGLTYGESGTLEVFPLIREVMTFVVLCEDTPIAWAAVDCQDGIVQIYVAESHRGRKLGGRLLDAAVEYNRAHMHTTVFWGSWGAAKAMAQKHSLPLPVEDEALARLVDDCRKFRAQVAATYSEKCADLRV